MAPKIETRNPEDPLWDLMVHYLNEARAQRGLPPAQPATGAASSIQPNQDVLDALTEISEARERSAYIIEARLLSGTPVSLSVHADTCIAALKCMIHDALHILPVHQKLLFGDVALDDDFELSDYNIVAGSSITIVVQEA